MLKDSLPPKQRRFVEEYVIDRNASAAYIRAGYKSDGNTASVCASQLLSKPNIRAAVDELIGQVSERCGITAERVLQEMGRLAFFDPRRLFGADGHPLPLASLDDDTAAAISGIDVLHIKDGEASVIKYKTADKNSALEKLAKHLGMYERDNRQKADPIAEILMRINQSSSSLPIVDDKEDDE